MKGNYGMLYLTMGRDYNQCWCTIEESVVTTTEDGLGEWHVSTIISMLGMHSDTTLGGDGVRTWES
jgi:hypothetical protein